MGPVLTIGLAMCLYIDHVLTIRPCRRLLAIQLLSGASMCEPLPFPLVALGRFLLRVADVLAKVVYRFLQIPETVFIGSQSVLLDVDYFLPQVCDGHC